MDNRIRILLVDDNPFFVLAAGEFLQLQESLQVIATAGEKQEALEKAQQFEFDVILLDLRLGEDCGLDMIPLFKERLPNTKIIILTMHDAAYQAIAMEKGADAFIHKTAMARSLVPVILQQMEPLPALKSEQRNIRDDREA